MSDYDTKAEMITTEIQTIQDNLRAMHRTINEDVQDLRTALEDQAQEVKTRLGGADGLSAEKMERIAATITRQQMANDRMMRRLGGLEAALQRSHGRDQCLLPEGYKAAKDFYLMRHAQRFGPEYCFDSDSVDEAKYEAYCRGFESYLRRDDRTLSHEEVKALTVGSNTDGGYFVPSQLSDRVVQKQFEISPIRSLATVQTVSTSALEIPVVTSIAAADWVAETATREATDTPATNLVEIPTHEIYAQPLISQKLLDDAAIDLERWLVTHLSGKFAMVENAAFVGGTGSGQPKGFLDYDDGTDFGEIEQVISGADGAVTYDGLVDLVTRLKTPYQTNARFVFGRAVMAQLLKLTDLQEQPLWQPGMQAGQPSTLLGRPVVLAEDMPDPDEDSLSIAYGDFAAGYTIVDRLGISVLRDPFTQKPYVKFYTTKRVGGAVVDFDAIKIQALSAAAD